MLIEQIPIQSLIVNPANDRHGELADEITAIRWLLEKHEQHMRNLTRDIVSEGKLYELPLVGPKGDRFLVFDGNRRVTCLKMLTEPGRARTPELIAFFESENRRWAGLAKNEVTCQVEHKPDDIDEILFRRHTGSQSGIGQRQWDDSAKANFIARTGKKLRINVAEEIEEKLLETGVLDQPGQIPRSNANRLLSNDQLRARVGFAVSGNQLEFTHDPSKVLEALVKIVSDLMSEAVVLPDIWNNTNKHAYLDRLEAAGKLPSPEDALARPQSFLSSRTAASRSADLREEVAAAMRAPRARDTLIPKDLPHLINWTTATSRHRDIWNELQHKLLLSRHPNAIAVLLRVLIELSVDHYINRSSLDGVHPNDKLALRTRKVAASLLAKGSIDQKYFDELRKIEQGDRIISASTMNSYVHSSTFSPSPQHLCAIWDLFSKYIALCINA